MENTKGYNLPSPLSDLVIFLEMQHLPASIREKSGLLFVFVGLHNEGNKIVNQELN